MRERSVRIDDRGIGIRRAGEDLALTWDEVTDVGVIAIERQRFVGLRLRNPGAAARSAPAAAT